MADFEIERPSVDVQPIQPTYNINTPSFTIEINGSTPGQRGEQGPPGQDGRDGIDGTNGIDGQDGVGVESIEQTSTSHESGGTNIITATLTDGSQSFFEIMNGEAGADSGIELLNDTMDIEDLVALNTGFYRVPVGGEIMNTTIGSGGLFAITHRIDDGFDIATFYILEDSTTYNLDYSLSPDYPNIEDYDGKTRFWFGEVSDDLGDGRLSGPYSIILSKDVINNLTTNDSSRPLSAAQGKALKDLLDAIATTIPTVNDATLTIQRNGSNLGTFTANASSNKTINVTVPTKTSDITNDSNFVNSTNISDNIKASGYTTKTDPNLGTIEIVNYAKRYGGSNYAYLDSKTVAHTVNSVTNTLDNVINGKQETLVSGTNIKTINNQSLLGSGNIDVSGGGGTPTDVRVNGTSITSNNVADILTETAYDSSTNKIATMSDIPDTSDFIDKDVNNLTNYSLTTTLQANKSITKGIEYIIGTQTAATNRWTGVSTDTGCSNSALYVGKTIIYHLPQAGSSNAATLNLTLPDGTTTGNKNIYRLNNTTVTTNFVAGCDILMVYDGTQWKINAYVDTSGSNTIGYQLRTNSAIFKNKTGYAMNRYTLLFEVDDGLSGAATTIATGTTKTTVPFKYIPGGVIKYYSASGSIANNANFTATGLWDQYTLNLGYTFNTGSILTSGKPVYMRCVVNSDGTLTPNYAGSPSHPIVQDLPTTEDGYVYVYLGQAYNTTNIELMYMHPIYEYKNGKIREYVDAAGGTVTETDPVFSASAAYGITSSDITTWNNKSDFSGNYNDLTNKPTIPTVPTTVSSFTNDAGYITGYTETDPVFVASAAHGITSTDITNWNNKSTFSGNYNDLTNKPTIPTVNNSTITIQKNGTNVDSFTTNASSNKSINITVPTKTSDITNDSGYITGITSSDIYNVLGYYPAAEPNIYAYNSILRITSTSNQTYIDLMDDITNNRPIIIRLGVSENNNVSGTKNGSTTSLWFMASDNSYTKITLSESGTAVTVTHETIEIPTVTLSTTTWVDGLF